MHTITDGSEMEQVCSIFASATWPSQCPARKWRLETLGVEAVLGVSFAAPAAVCATVVADNSKAKDRRLIRSFISFLLVLDFVSFFFGEEFAIGRCGGAIGEPSCRTE